MNEDKIRQFESEQLDILLNDLKDIDNYTGFKDGAFKYYLGKYQADILLDYIEQLKSQLEQSKNETKQRDDVIDEAKKHCNQEISASTVQYERRHKQQDLVYKVAHERILKILEEVNKHE